MSMLPPSTPAPEGSQPTGPEPLGSQSLGPPTLSPLSPESPAELEPLSPGSSDNATALANPPQRTAGKRPKPYRWATWVISFLVFAVIVAVLGLLYLGFGTVSGTEFDSIAWTTREFRFVREPWSDTQLTDIKHDSKRAFTVDPVIATHITGGPARPVHPRWDLVRIYRGMSSGEGEALILLRYLQADDSQGKNYWADWTTNHPQAAPILWSAVRDAVHLQRYDRLPEIFDRVRVDDDPQVLKEALSQVMLALALDEARRRIKVGDQAAAGRAARVGLSYGESNELEALAADAAQADAAKTATESHPEEN